MSTGAIAIAGTALWVASRPQVDVLVIPEVRIVEGEALECAHEQTGTPLPADAGTTPAPGTVRFMGSDPHVPLAEVVDGKLSESPGGACSDWARPRERWLALDRWGAIAGTHESLAAEAYDVTGCYEMTTRRLEGEDGVGLLASPGYVPGPSFAWTPSAEERAGLDALLTRLDALFVPSTAAREPLFFRTAPDSEGVRTPMAVMGGRVLLVAVLVDDAWAVRHLELTYGLEPYTEMPYQPLAVADLDGDGGPEIVFRESEGPAWNDTILASDGFAWDRAAASIGGGTI